MATEKINVCIIGSGNWATTIARNVANNVSHSQLVEPKVNMYVYQEIIEGKKLTEIINTTHINVKYMPDFLLPENIVSVSFILCILSLFFMHSDQRLAIILPTYRTLSYIQALLTCCAITASCGFSSVPFLSSLFRLLPVVSALLSPLDIYLPPAHSLLLFSLLPKVAYEDVVTTARDADILIFVIPATFVSSCCKTLLGMVKPTAHAVSLIKGYARNDDGQIRLISHLITAELTVRQF